MALLGLMFVALSMDMHLVSDKTRADFKVFVTPSVTYFVSALLLCSVMLVPVFTPPALAAILFLSGSVGLARIAQPVRHLVLAARQHQDFSLGDWLAQIILPVVNCALIVIGSICLAVNQWSIAFASLWLATVLLVMFAIANTWSLVLWIIEQRQS